MQRLSERRNLAFMSRIMSTAPLHSMKFKLYVFGLGKMVNDFIHAHGYVTGLSSLIRDLIQDLSLRSIEKLLSTLAVLTDKVKSMLKNITGIKENACLSQAAKLSAAV